MKRLKLSRWFAVLALAIALVPNTASAQEADTLTISGSFSMQSLQGTVGADLAQVYANGNGNAWTLTLHGVTHSYDSYFKEWYDEWGYYGSDERWITRVHATSFDFEFFGPDADVLNAVVSQQLVGGSLTNGAFLEVWNGDGFDARDPTGRSAYSSWNLGLSSSGVSYYVLGNGDGTGFPRDVYGYPIVVSQVVMAYYSSISDFRTITTGELWSFGNLVVIGLPEPGMPPPPLPRPTLSISDRSVREGNKGTNRLDLTMTLSRISENKVTVHYATANGTAQKKSDYTATSGTLTIPAGQTQGTISVAIKGDRQREKDETFSVLLSNAVGATITDGVATATILNDD